MHMDTSSRCGKRCVTTKCSKLFDAELRHHGRILTLSGLLTGTICIKAESADSSKALPLDRSSLKETETESPVVEFTV